MTKPTTETPGDEEKPGPDGSFEAFYQNRLSRLVMWGRLAGLNLEDAKDAAQEAMLAIYRNWSLVSTFEEKDRVAYAWTASRSAIVNLHRKASRQRAAVTELTRRGQVAEPDRSAHTEAFDRLRRLPGAQREVMLLRVEGLNVGDIATCLGLNRSTVRSHVHNARKALKEDDHG